VDENKAVHEATDRSYWEKRSTKKTMAAVDELLETVRKFDPSPELKYNKFTIGLAREGAPDNFVIFRPKKYWVHIEPRLTRSDEMQEHLDSAGLDVMDDDERWGRYRIHRKSGLSSLASV
jgi:hypothetical protein